MKAHPAPLQSPKLPSAPPADCPHCPRLAEFRADNRGKYPDYFNDPVPNFGDPKARLLIVGLAPGLHGANRTGRPFTGDWAGDLLYATLLKHGLATGIYDERPDDGLQLVDCMIANSVRCVPPQNKPLPAEINTCRPFLQGTLQAMPTVRAILSLGQIAHNSLCSALGIKKSAFKFGHGAQFEADGLCLISSYHCSRYNTNTGVLTEAMFNAVMLQAKKAAQRKG